LEQSLFEYRRILVLCSLFLAGLACARGDVSFSPNAETVTRSTRTPVSDTPQPSATPSATNIELSQETATPSRPTPIASPTLPATPTLSASGTIENVLYESQPGDILRSLAVRFGVIPSDIRTTAGLLPQDDSLIDPGLILVIPDRLTNIGPEDLLLPDSEVAYSPHTSDFDVASYVEEQGGFLNVYNEFVSGALRTGPEVVELAGLVHSINPRLLLAFLEYTSGWVTNPATPTGDDLEYPIGNLDFNYQGLYRQLTWLSNELGKGYYGWRSGTLIDLTLLDGSFVRLAPSLNAGTVAIQYTFSLREGHETWIGTVSPVGFISKYREMFGDPWEYWHPLYEADLVQPPMTLPFFPGVFWSFTGGPHGAWEKEAAWAALDFAPAASEPGCVPSDEWIVASAPGLVVRSGNGLVVIDLDGDGFEQTGWVIMYLHVGSENRVVQGTFVEQGDLIGHPSCEGGVATGTHLHMTRKFNGEWILADGPLAFDLSGWVARAGSLPYQGALIKGDQTVLACSCSSAETLILR
jgi:hypothetical protein